MISLSLIILNLDQVSYIITLSFLNLWSVIAKYKADDNKIDLSKLNDSGIFNIPFETENKNGYNEILLLQQQQNNGNYCNRMDQQTLQQKIECLKNYFQELLKANKPSIIV